LNHVKSKGEPRTKNKTKKAQKKKQQEGKITTHLSHSLPEHLQARQVLMRRGMPELDEPRREAELCGDGSDGPGVRS
jgi:hypothetical protein